MGLHRGDEEVGRGAPVGMQRVRGTVEHGHAGAPEADEDLHLPGLGDGLVVARSGLPRGTTSDLLLN